MGASMAALSTLAMMGGCRICMPKLAGLVWTWFTVACSMAACVLFADIFNQFEPHGEYDHGFFLHTAGVVMAFFAAVTFMCS